ncbi:pyridoxamine 5'-phosphate oxidase family protein [Catalinimonas niigatensis]|uniref:pyridoxamine 5'-phosphate oxidase family protein n=1 Tax=Catalinimonas niigatensis TaxID=1397264 RepID=UPI002665453E|nr:pyridoxamine 5'-phosphate oxidase family protein [Catalinimonas niigatensis]WPP50360.1 pyridoxamine 5'-phosphate oxidase family protein [Catalinimonas niigatensis]
MGKQLEKLSPELEKFIQKQNIFFVATAMSDGRVNLSPKGMDTFRVLDSKRVMWLNLTGSGNETAAHLKESNRITVMFCAFEGKPLILRLYGTAKTYHPRDEEWGLYIHLFPDLAGSRQLIDIHVELVQTSCGMAVPFMEYQGEREELKFWAEKKGEARLKEYWKEKNTSSLDGQPTGILE